MHVGMGELLPAAQHRRQRANHQDNEGRIYKVQENPLQYPSMNKRDYNMSHHVQCSIPVYRAIRA